MTSIAERHKYILESLAKNGFIKVNEIAKELEVTPVTIRKDLKHLEEKKLLYRTHGSASPVNIDGRFDDACAYFFHIYFISKRNRSNATHTACIQSFVAFTDTFVVFRYREDFVVVSVCQYEYRALDTAQELFNHNGCRCGTEHAAEHFFQFFLRFIQSRK